MNCVALAVAMLAVVGAGSPPPEASGKYLVILNTEPSEGAARQELGRSNCSSAFVLRTDDYEGLRQGFYVVVDSVHRDLASAKARCAALERNGTQCYVRGAGKRRGSPEEDVAPRAVPGGGTVVFNGRLDARARSVPLMVVSYPPTARSEKRAGTSGKSRAASVFVFPSGEPIKIRDHDLLPPGAEAVEGVECGPLRLLPLGKASPLPAVLAQRCNNQGVSEFRYLLFDGARLEAPAKGMASWSPSVYPDTTHERFVPNDDPKVPGGLSKRHGDGRTVVEAVEGKKTGPRNDAFSVRDVLTEWAGGKLVVRRGPWRDLDEE